MPEDPKKGEVVMRNIAQEDLRRIRAGQQEWDRIVKILAASDLDQPRDVERSLGGEKMSGNMKRCKDGGVILRLWTNHGGGEQKIYIPPDLFGTVSRALLRAEEKTV